MRTGITLLLAVAGVFGQKPPCNANNCARALTGTAAGLDRPVSRIQTDCRSLIARVTVYPPAPTVYITSGSTYSTSAVTNYPSPVNSGTVPNDIPAYAKSACASQYMGTDDSPYRFFRACSCAGITQYGSTYTPSQTATVTVPTPSSPFRYCGNPITPPPQNYDPSCDGAGDCVCLSLANGKAACIVNKNCPRVKNCGTDADCSSRETCIVNSGCAEGGVCVATNDFLQCFNPNPPGKMFRKRDVSARRYYNAPEADGHAGGF